MNARLGKIVTFYSYKGGTGRSMALANFAWILAASGKRVLTIDWDLEAPGLHRYFRPFLIDADLFETDGLIDVCWQFAATAMGTIESPTSSHDDEESFGESLEAIAVRLDHEFASGGYIEFVGAGRQTATYSQRVNTFAWSRFYDIGGSQLLQTARRHLTEQYDWVLIDSRTGVSDTAGICTIQLPDAVVACFTLNRQSVEGVAAVLESIRSFSGESVVGSRIKFFPIATRIENAEQVRLESARGYARALMAQFLPKLPSPREYWDAMEVAYRPAYAFEEVLAAYGDATGATGAADTMLAQVERIAQLISGEHALRIPEILDEDRRTVLAKYALGDLRVEPSSKPIGSVAAAVVTSIKPVSMGGIDAHESDDGTAFLRGVLAKEQVWRSKGFSWWYLLSRRELDMLTEEDRKKFGRTMAYYVLQSDRAESVRHSSTRNFFRAIVFGIATTLGCYVYLIMTGGAYGLVNTYSLERVALVLGMSAWMAALLLAASIQYVARDSPYGLRTTDIYFNILLGPFREPIRDYESLKDGGRNAP